MYEKVEKLMQERDVKVSDVVKATGISASVFTDWKKGRYTPKADKLYALAQYFDVPMEYFFDTNDDLEYYYNVIQKQIGSYLNKKSVYRASAGEGAYNDTYTDETITVDDGYEYATVVGESMLPELRDGDIVKILRQTETTPHDSTLVKVDGEHATIKFVEIVENGVWLRASNKEVFEDKFFSIQEVMTLPVTILGKVVSFERKL